MNTDAIDELKEFIREEFHNVDDKNEVSDSEWKQKEFELNKQFAQKIDSGAIKEENLKDAAQEIISFMLENNLPKEEAQERAKMVVEQEYGRQFDEQEE